MLGLVYYEPKHKLLQSTWMVHYAKLLQPDVLFDTRFKFLIDFAFFAMIILCIGNCIRHSISWLNKFYWALWILKEDTVQSVLEPESLNRNMWVLCLHSYFVLFRIESVILCVALFERNYRFYLCFSIIK